MADGMANFWCVLVDGVPWCGRCYGHMFLTCVWQMLSQGVTDGICGRWFLPMFLLSDGPLALMYIDPLIILARLWSSFTAVLKLSALSKSCCWSANIPLFILHPVTPMSINHPTFLNDEIWVCGRYQESFDGFFSSEVCLYPMCSAYVL